MRFSVGFCFSSPISRLSRASNSFVGNGWFYKAQPLSSLLNKLNLKSNSPETSVGCNFEEAVDLILSTDGHCSFDSNPLGRTSTGNEISLTNICQDATNSGLLQSNVFVGVPGIGKGREAIVDNTHTILNCLIGLITYPHNMLIQETAIQCLLAASELPHTRIYPMRIKVLQAMAKAPDDTK